MPRNTSDLGPIRENPLSGPAFDEWDSRKEENNNSEACSKDFRRNFEALKTGLNDDLAQIVEQL